jgi:hypothetical protein
MLPLSYPAPVFCFFCRMWNVSSDHSYSGIIFQKWVTHFCGNFPESVLVEGCYDPHEEYDSDWFCLIPRSRMSPDAEHVFERSKGQLTNSEKPI